MTGLEVRPVAGALGAMIEGIDIDAVFDSEQLDGVRQALLTVPPGYEVHGDYSPVWSPDGMSLLMPIAPIAPNEPRPSFIFTSYTPKSW